MGVLGLRSFLRLDQYHRRSSVRESLGIASGYVLSDTTLSRRLSVYPIEALRGYLHDEVGDDSTGIDGYRLGWLDGSLFGKFYGSVLVLDGQCLDLQVYGKGHELAAPTKLLDRATSGLGRGFVDVLLLDGLYLNAPFINRALRDFGVGQFSAGIFNCCILYVSWTSCTPFWTMNITKFPP